MAIDFGKFLNTGGSVGIKTTSGIDFGKFLKKELGTKSTPSFGQPQPTVPTKFSPFAGTLTKAIPESQRVGYGELSRIRNIKGGGQYKVDQYGKGPVLTPRAYGTFETEEGKERDHIIPVSLGGTSYDPNIQMLENNKSGRQEGKVLVELAAINKYKKGDISLNQARADVLNWQNKEPDYFKEVVKNLPKSIAENIIKGVSYIPKKAFVEPLGKALELGKNILQGTMNFAGSTGLSILEALGKREVSEPLAIRETDPKWQQTFQKVIFGNEPVKSLAQRISEAEIKYPKISEPGFNIGETKITLPFAGVIGMSVLDFTTGGGKDDVVRLIAKSDDIGLIAKTLKSIGVADDFIETTATKMATINKVDDITKALDNINDLQKTTSQVAETTAKSVSKERGFVSSVKQAYPEVKAGGQYIPKGTDELAIKAKNLIKSDIDEAERLALNYTDDNAVATASELIKHYGDEAIKATNPATRVALNDRAANIANTTARNLTEQGRAIQAASILGRLTPEGQIRFAAKEIQKYNEAIDKSKGGILGLKKKIPELTGKEADEILTEMKAIDKLPNGTEKAMRFQALQKKISSRIPSSLYDKIVSVWKAGLLTGLKTSGVNILSNVSHAVSETIKDIPAIAVDKVSSLFTGERTIGLSLGQTKGIKEGFEKGWRYVSTGFDERNIAQKLDYKKVNFGQSRVGKALQKYEESVFGIIGAEDQPFYYGAKARSLADQATADAINKGIKGTEKTKHIDNLVSNPTDEMLRYGVMDAEIAVYQNRTLLGKVAKGIQNLPGGEILVPFGRTPSAVATQILNYSPVGIIKTIAQNIGKGRFDQRLFSQGIARGITGTAVLYLGAQLGKKGLVNLDYPTNEKERKLWELEGRKPNTVKIGGKWRSTQVLGPAGNLLLVGAHFDEALESNEDITEAYGQALAGSAKSFSEQTFLRGVNQAANAITDPGRSAKYYIGSTAASAIPTIFSDIAKATDSKERRTEDILDNFKSRMPGLRYTLEPKVTVLGEEIESIGNPLEIMADPTRPSQIIENPISLELRRLWDKGYKVSPTLLGDKKGYEGLTPEENTQLWKRTGELISNKLYSLLQQLEYFSLADDKKADIIEDVVDKSKIVGRAEMALELTQDLTGEELTKKLSELKASGLITREVYNKYLEIR